MSAPLLAEGTVNLIITQLKTYLPGALADVRSHRADAEVTTEPPNEYLIIERAKGYKAPVVFVICTDFDMRVEQHAANFIDANAKVNVSVLIEDRNLKHLTIKSWRYQSALMQTLALSQLTSSDGKVKLSLVVRNAAFSPAYSTTKNQGVDSMFRKEVMLELDVTHRENF